MNTVPLVCLSLNSRWPYGKLSTLFFYIKTTIHVAMKITKSIIKSESVSVLFMSWFLKAFGRWKQNSKYLFYHCNFITLLLLFNRNRKFCCHLFVADITASHFNYFRNIIFDAAIVCTNLIEIVDATSVFCLVPWDI